MVMEDNQTTPPPEPTEEPAEQHRATQSHWGEGHLTGGHSISVKPAGHNTWRDDQPITVDEGMWNLNTALYHDRVCKCSGCRSWRIVSGQAEED
eukprot:XP_014064788.1 PREDICTED: uncharacterized protein LOC106610137 isoform X2 [Salmo salar]